MHIALPQNIAFILAELLNYRDIFYDFEIVNGFMDLRRVWFYRIILYNPIYRNFFSDFVSAGSCIV